MFQCGCAASVCKYNPPRTDVPVPAEYVAGNYESQRTEVLEDEHWECTNGNWVSTVRTEIEKRLGQQLRRVIALDNADASAGDRRFANDQRQCLFGEVQDELAKVFGPGRTESAVEDDASTMDVDESANNRPGFYTGVLTRETATVLGRTNAAWTNHIDYPVSAAGVAEDAVDNLSTQTYARADPDRVELGAFAYSPLDPTAEYSSESDRLYPATGANSTVTATYAGRTAAAQRDFFYRGDIEAKVFWDPSDIGDSRVTVTVSDLQDTDSGDPLQFGYLAPANALVDEDLAGAGAGVSLKWTAEVTNSGEVQFKSTDPVSGDAPYRPACGGGCVDGAMALRWRDRTGANTDELRIRRSCSEFWVLNVGTSTSGTNWGGALTFKGINTGNVDDANPATLTGDDFDTAKAAFEAGQDSPDYPTHLVRGFNHTATAVPSGPRHSLILLFKDGSTATMHEWFNHNQGLVGITGNPASGYQAGHYTSDPALDTRDYLLFSDLSPPWSKDLLTENGTGNTIGVGRPDMTPGQLAAAFLRANDYVNVTMEDPTARAATLDGMFVGADQDGPLGLIGTWSLTGGAFGVGVERGPIRGAFGADIQP